MSGPVPVDGGVCNQLRRCEYVLQISGEVKSRLEGPVCRFRSTRFDHPL